MSAPERAELAYFLITSLEPEEARAEAGWRLEVIRRVTDIRNRQAVGRPADDLFTELRGA